MKPIGTKKAKEFDSFVASRAVEKQRASEVVEGELDTEDIAMHLAVDTDEGQCEDFDQETAGKVLDLFLALSDSLKSPAPTIEPKEENREKQN